MKYSATILLALFGLTAATVLHHPRDHIFLGRSRISHRINDNDIDYNNRNNKHDRDTNAWNNNNNNNRNRREGDQLLLEQQRTILQLLTNLQQRNIYQNLVRLGNNFNPRQTLNRFNNQQAVKKFLRNYENNDFLPLNEVFSPTNQQHQNQAAQLFTFLYSAQDWTTLKQAAAWARDRFNTEQFAYVLSAVVLNHPITQGVAIPALYEIIPNAFLPATTVQKVLRARLQGLQQLTLTSNNLNQNRNKNNYNRNNNNDNTDSNRNNRNNNNNNNNNNNVWGSNNPTAIFADNDGSLISNAGTAENPELRLSYFTEDIGINDLHARFNLQYPVFLGVNNNKNYYTSNLERISRNDNTVNTNNWDVRRGEAFYFAHQQLYARYVLERLSNKLPIPHPINLNDRIWVRAA